MEHRGLGKVFRVFQISSDGAVSSDRNTRNTVEA
jgi:hypothetical protein